MKLVIIESPFAGATPELRLRNLRYARAALRDSLLRREAPFASHLLYTQEGVFDDNVLEERVWGIEAGLAWGQVASLTAVYCDLGISKGMEEGIRRARIEGRECETRFLRGMWIEC